MRSSGSTFVRGIKGVLRPIRDYTQSYVDDMAVHSDIFRDHLYHIDCYLNTMKSAGFMICDYNKDPVSITYGPSQYQLPTLM